MGGEVRLSTEADSSLKASEVHLGKSQVSDRTVGMAPGTLREFE